MAVAEAICFSKHQLSRLGREPEDVFQDTLILVYTHKEEMESGEEKQEFPKVLIGYHHFLYVCRTAVSTIYVVVRDDNLEC